MRVTEVRKGVFHFNKHPLNALRHHPLLREGGDTVPRGDGLGLGAAAWAGRVARNALHPWEKSAGFALPAAPRARLDMLFQLGVSHAVTEWMMGLIHAQTLGASRASATPAKIRNNATAPRHPTSSPVVGRPWSSRLACVAALHPLRGCGDGELGA